MWESSYENSLHLLLHRIQKMRVQTLNFREFPESGEGLLPDKVI